MITNLKCIHVLTCLSSLYRGLELEMIIIDNLIKAVFGSSILGMHSLECISARMYFRECIL
jgi:hypothetical protein